MAPCEVGEGVPWATGSVYRAVQQRTERVQCVREERG